MPITLGILAQSRQAVAASDFVLLETQVLTGSEASVTFSGLAAYASTYKHLQLRAVTRNSSTAGGSTTNFGANALVRFNGDSTAGNYRAHYLEGNGSAVTSGDYSTGNNGAYIPDLGGIWDTHTADAFTVGVVDILDFGSSSKNKTIRSLVGFSTGGRRVSLSSSLWMSTAAATSLLFTQDGTTFKANSRFSLYGVK